MRKFLLTIWNTYYFFVTYARIDGWTPQASKAPPVGDRPVMDRWILAELAETVRAVDAGLDDFDSTGAGRAISRLRRRPVELVRAPQPQPVLGRDAV